MSWLRTGDNAATNPIVLRVRSLVRASKRVVPEPDFAPCEVFGFVSLCATLSAGHGTDYVVSYGTAFTVSPARVDRLLDLAVKAGYMTKGRQAGADPEWVIIDDPKFLHMRTTAELAWEAQRKADSGNRLMVARVRLRDGDGCRYCGVVVIWSGDRKSGRNGTYDHREPGQPARLETYVVSCGNCNSERGNKPDADERVPLMPVPESPFYSEGSRRFIFDRLGSATPVDVRPGVPDTATCDPASGRTPQQRQNDGAPGTAAIGASADSAGAGSAASGFTGSGRVGPGRESSGTTGSAEPRRRGRRGNRNRKPEPPTESGQ